MYYTGFTVSNPAVIHSDIESGTALTRHKPKG